MMALSFLLLAGLFQTGLSFPSASIPASFNALSTSLKKITGRRLLGSASDSSLGSRFASREGKKNVQTENKWIPAKLVPGSVRSACPWMNTAANHGFISRDGKQISVAEFDGAIRDSVGFSQDLAHTITTGMLTKLGVLTNTSADDSVRINIDETNAHDRTEHDASLTRLDASQGDAVTVQPELVQKLLDDTVPIYYPFLNTSSLGRSRARREDESQELGNPPLPDRFKGGALAEAGIILLAMGENIRVTTENADSFSAPKNRVKKWLDEERFPYEAGFQPSDPPREISELNALANGVAKFQTL